MKFIKQSSIDNLIDETHWRCYGATEAKKKGVHYFCFSLLLKELLLCCACCKELFYDNSAGFGGNSVQFIMKNTQRWTSLKLSKSSWDHRNSTSTKSKAKMQRKFMTKYCPWKDRSILLWSIPKNSTAKADDWAKQMMLTDRGFSQRCKNLWLALLLMKALFLL
jgi:hypothetical protein